MGSPACPSLRRASTTSAFRRWFGESSVLDADGAPLVVFHGTNAVFTRFEFTEDIGFHFGSAECADERLRQTSGDGDYVEGASILPVYLRVRRPLVSPDLFDWNPRSVALMLRDAGVISDGEAQDTPIIDLAQVKAWLARAGYDGIRYRNETEGGGDSYIVFDPSAVKSAIGNRGTYRGDHIHR